MKKLNGFSGVLSTLARALGKPVLYLHWNWPQDANGVELYQFEELVKAVPFISLQDDGQAVCDGFMFVVCDSREQMDELFWQVVGDDGPTPSNPYDGPMSVYALTCDENGQPLNENT